MEIIRERQGERGRGSNACFASLERYFNRFLPSLASLATFEAGRLHDRAK
jgi:hypothetical protein